MFSPPSLQYSLVITWVATLCLVMTEARPACATVDLWQIIKGQKVYANFASNHDYYSRDVPFRYRHAVDALAIVREDLVQQGKIKDLPIVIRQPPSASSPSSYIFISQKKDVSLFEGEGDEETLRGSCYEIHVGKRPSYAVLLALTATLKDLTPAKRRIDFPNMEQLELSMSQDVARFRDITQHHDPNWSPDGQLLLYTVWQNETVHFRLLNLTARVVRKLEPLDGYMVIRPLWSPDARYVAYASLKEVKVFDTKANLTQTIALSAIMHTSRNETLLAFDPSSTQLTLAADTDLLSSYNAYTYDIKTQKLNVVAVGKERPTWATESAVEKPYSEERRVLSPDGKSSALMKRSLGVKRLEVRSGTRTIQVASLPVLAVAKSSRVEIPGPARTSLSTPRPLPTSPLVSTPMPAPTIAAPPHAQPVDTPASPAFNSVFARVVGVTALLGVALLAFYFRKR